MRTTKIAFILFLFVITTPASAQKVVLTEQAQNAAADARMQDAQADLRAAQAASENAALLYERSKQLMAQGLLSASDNDAARSKALSAAARVEQAQAVVRQAQAQIRSRPASIEQAQSVIIQKKQLVPEGTWWRDQRYASVLSLTADQQKRMDEVFQQSRIRLIDLTATLDKEEAILEPLMQAERLDEARTAAQIDKVADARAELEKANARMLLGIRQVLTPEQWKMLDSSSANVWPGGTKWKVVPQPGTKK